MTVVDVLKVAQYAKGYAAAAGSIVTVLLGLFGPDTQVGQVLLAVSAVCTIVATVKIPNAPQADQSVGDAREVFYGEH